MNENLYALSIPCCCSLKTYKDHEKISFCGQLLLSIKNNNIINCTGCKYIIKEKLYIRILEKIKNFFKRVG